MEYNLVTNLKICPEIVSQLMNGNVSLLYYSHIPSIIVALLMGFLILTKGEKNLSTKIFFSFTLLFSLWTTLNLVAWISSDSREIMFAWSLLGIMSSLFYIMSLYFMYVFIDKKDVSFFKKIILGLIILPIIIFTPTRFNLGGFEASYCYASDNSFLNYIYFPQIVASAWILFIAISRYIKADKNSRKKIVLLSTGIIFFLSTFFGTGYIADSFEMYSVEIYGLFALVVFMGFLAYLIVKFKAFNIKLLGAQALVAALVILISSMLFFAESTTNQILILITMALSLGFGYILIKSVKAEVERKEQLQVMSDNLAVANDRLKKLDNAKSEFISIASHQLRTPLTSIKGYISLITEGTYGAVSAEVKDALSRVYLSNERLIKLVENLLNVSRIESGRMEYTWEKGNVEEMIMGLMDDFVFAAKKNGLYLNAKMPDESLPPVRMDKAKLTEVISNTIDNAIKYTKKGGVTVAAELAPSGKSVRVTVSDTGIGIPAENMDEMFQKFSRGKDTTRLHATGTGLGMFVAKNIIEAHQGRIWVESAGEDKGSRFIIELPV